MRSLWWSKIPGCHNSFVKVFPNPTAGKVTVVYKLANEKGRLVLTDMTGRMVRSFELEGKKMKFEFDISEFRVGMLNFDLIDKDISIGRGKIVIMK